MHAGRIKDIFLKEIAVEFRQKYALGGIVLFTSALVYLIYKVFNNLTGLEWSVMLWVITLFAGLQATVKSFMQERKETYFYYYTIFDPNDLLLAKWLYNFVMIVLLFGLTLLFMSIFMGMPVKDYMLFAKGSMLGLAGLSTVFTFVSLIAASEHSSSTLMSVLAIPLVLPIMLLMLKITTVSARLIQDTSVDQDILLLVGINAIFLGSIFLLFPVLWRA